MHDTVSLQRNGNSCQQVFHPQSSEQLPPERFLTPLLCNEGGFINAPVFQNMSSGGRENIPLLSLPSYHSLPIQLLSLLRRTKSDVSLSFKQKRTHLPMGLDPNTLKVTQSLHNNSTSFASSSPKINICSLCNENKWASDFKPLPTHLVKLNEAAAVNFLTMPS